MKAFNEKLLGLGLGKGSVGHVPLGSRVECIGDVTRSTSKCV